MSHEFPVFLDSLRLKVAPAQQWDVRREYLRRLKHAFDSRGIEIPFPHLTLYAGQGKDGSAPPLPVTWYGDPLGQPSMATKRDAEHSP